MDKYTTDNFKFIISRISPRIRMILEKLPESVIEEVQEIRLRAGSPVVIVGKGNSSFLTKGSKCTLIVSDACVFPQQSEITDTLNKMCGYSMHSHYEDILNGYVTLENGARVGVCGTAVYEKNEVKTVKDISGLNIRIPRQITGASKPLFESVFRYGPQNLLLAGPPSSGKTTILRDIAYQFSSGAGGKYRKVCVVDERKELFPDNSSHSAGPNTDIIYGFPKAIGISMAVRTLSPEIIVCDEIGGIDEAEAVLEGLNTGVKFILSIHSDSANELRKKKSVHCLFSEGGFECVALLKDSASPGEISKIYSAEEVLYENNSGNYNADGGNIYVSSMLKAN